jgi:hypothetical protein
MYALMPLDRICIVGMSAAPKSVTTFVTTMLCASIIGRSGTNVQLSRWQQDRLERFTGSNRLQRLCGML